MVVHGQRSSGSWTIKLKSNSFTRESGTLRHRREDFKLSSVCLLSLFASRLLLLFPTSPLIRAPSPLSYVAIPRLATDTPPPLSLCLQLTRFVSSCRGRPTPQRSSSETPTGSLSTCPRWYDTPSAFSRCHRDDASLPQQPRHRVRRLRTHR